jgi:hypothetical protein
MTENHARLLETLVKEARYDNDFDENAAFNAVLNTPEISAGTAQGAIDVFRRARYDNGLNDRDLFLMVLRSAQ